MSLEFWHPALFPTHWWWVWLVESSVSPVHTIIQWLNVTWLFKIHSIISSEWDLIVDSPSEYSTHNEYVHDFWVAFKSSSRGFKGNENHHPPIRGKNHQGLHHLMPFWLLGLHGNHTPVHYHNTCKYYYYNYLWYCLNFQMKLQFFFMLTLKIYILCRDGEYVYKNVMGTQEYDCQLIILKPNRKANIVQRLLWKGCTCSTIRIIYCIIIALLTPMETDVPINQNIF